MNFNIFLSQILHTMLFIFKTSCFIKLSHSVNLIAVIKYSYCSLLHFIHYNTFFFVFSETFTDVSLHSTSSAFLEHTCATVTLSSA